MRYFEDMFYVALQKACQAFEESMYLQLLRNFAMAGHRLLLDLQPLTLHSPLNRFFHILKLDRRFTSRRKAERRVVYASVHQYRRPIRSVGTCQQVRW